MEYSRATVVDGEVVITETTNVNQSEMTGECWIVQFRGLTGCKECEFVDTEDCGGVDIRKTGKNSKGFEVPLG